MAAEAGFPSVPCAIPSHDSSFGEFVAHPVHGEDVLGAARIRLDLPADVLDVRVDGALEGVDVGAADRVEQLPAREDAARPACKRGEQLEFGRRQIDRGAVGWRSCRAKSRPGRRAQQVAPAPAASDGGAPSVHGRPARAG